MQKSVTIKWKILIFLADVIILTRQSIAGITYHDDFGVEEKYRDVCECDPFYWHPLHLPEQCAEMFSDLIRSRVAMAAGRPVRVVTKRNKPVFSQPLARFQEDIYSLRHYYNYFEPEYEQPIYETEYIYGNDNDYSAEGFEPEEVTNTYQIPTYLSQYDKMLEFLRHDISKTLIAPSIGMSNYGPVAMYQQPVSKKSRDIINKIARAYARANKVDNDNNGYYYGKIEFSPGNTKANNQDTDKTVSPNVENIQKIKKKKNKAKKKAEKQKRTKGLMIQ